MGCVSRALRMRAPLAILHHHPCRLSVTADHHQKEAAMSKKSDDKKSDKKKKRYTLKLDGDDAKKVLKALGYRRSCCGKKSDNMCSRCPKQLIADWKD